LGTVLSLLLTFCGLLFVFPNASGTAPRAPQSPPESNGYVGDAACQTCHVKEFQGYEQTRHHRTSQLPSNSTILGKFTSGRNTLSTLNPQVNFRMDAKSDAFFETAITGKVGQKKARTERIDLVIGSGRKGQTYLYWRGNQLFELPVSYWTATGRWANSPGYVDGSADFERAITPRCLECHATSFDSLPDPSGSHFDRRSFVLGISCERCHGPAADHVRRHTANTETPTATIASTTFSEKPGKPLPPIETVRERQIDICGQCHGGVGESAKPALSFRPGEPLGDSIRLEAFDPRASVDVHGNQVALLEKSRCFQSSASMTCSTCHDAHNPEREAATYSDRCLTCHKPQSCPTVAKMSHSEPANCIDCHMPIQISKSLVLDIDDEQVGARVRTHWIRAYPQTARSNPIKPR
jgi:hypothetical protein